MKMSDGVEWACHACAVLAGLPAGVGLSAAHLAEFHEVPPAYMAKQMQALARSGIVVSTRGAGGGYRIARPADEITLWDIAAAIEGDEPAFRCTEIRQQGPCPATHAECRRPCQIAAAFARAETAWRAELKTISVADLIAEIASGHTPARRAALAAWFIPRL